MIKVGQIWFWKKDRAKAKVISTTGEVFPIVVQWTPPANGSHEWPVAEFLAKFTLSESDNVELTLAKYEV